MKIINESEINYDYVLPDGSTHSDSKISNEVIAEVINKCFTIHKSTDTHKAKKCDIINQKVDLCNNSSTTILNLFFKDIMTEGATYVEGSVKINGIPKPSYDLENGFYLPDLNSGECLTVEYQITITDDSFIRVKNYATVNYSVYDPLQGNVNFSQNSNTVRILIKKVNLSITKYVDKNTACKGDILTYTTKICNKGKITANNLFFYDYLGNSVSFIYSSVKVNGINIPSLNPCKGFYLSDIHPGECIIVEFKVRVN